PPARRTQRQAGALCCPLRLRTDRSDDFVVIPPASAQARREYPDLNDGACAQCGGASGRYIVARSYFGVSVAPGIVAALRLCGRGGGLRLRGAPRCDVDRPG